MIKGILIGAGSVGFLYTAAAYVLMGHHFASTAHLTPIFDSVRMRHEVLLVGLGVCGMLAAALWASAPARSSSRIPLPGEKQPIARRFPTRMQRPHAPANTPTAQDPAGRPGSRPG